MKKILAITAVAALMSSCGIYTRYEAATEVPDQLYGEDVLANDTTNFGRMAWRDLFTDPQLQVLIEHGLANNTNLKTAQLRVKEAEATLLSAKLAYLPSFALAPQGTMNYVEGGSAKWSYTLPAVASWELDIFGRLRNAKRQSQAQLAMTKDYQQATRAAIIAGIANTYYTLLMLDEQLSITRQTSEAWKETVRSARALMAAGRYNEAGVAQMEAASYQVESSVLDLEDKVNQVENSLALLLAETPRHYSRGKLAEQQMPENFNIGVPVSLLAARPDVRAAERNLESAFYTTNAARSSFYPQITLSGSAGWTNSAGSMIINPGKFVAAAVGSLTQPLFAQGKLLAQYKVARAQQEQASLDFQQTLLNAGVEVNEALMAWQTAREKSELIGNQVAAQEKALRSTTLLMEHGTATYLEVLTARQNYLSARLSQTANTFTELQSLISLYQALGGGAE